MKSMKESAANVAASAKSGMEKTKATAQEKVEKISAHDPQQKEMARQKKEDRVNQAELHKQEVRENNAAAKQTGGTQFTTGAGTGTGIGSGGTHFTTGPGTGAEIGTPDYLTGTPEYSTGQPTGRVTEGVVGSQNPVGDQYTGSGRGRVPIRETDTGVGHPEHGGTGGAYGDGGY
ncbi:hypothetical protein U1Q18_012762 [Sarracenia purpurea var. burkii]